MVSIVACGVAWLSRAGSAVLGVGAEIQNVSLGTIIHAVETPHIAAIIQPNLIFIAEL